MLSPPLMPWPKRLLLSGQAIAPGRLRAAPGADPSLEDALARINAQLRGNALLPGEGETLPIAFEIADPRPATPRLGDDESYSLEIAADRLRILAPRLWGAQHALATLMQLGAFSRGARGACPSQEKAFSGGAPGGHPPQERAFSGEAPGGHSAQEKAFSGEAPRARPAQERAFSGGQQGSCPPQGKAKGTQEGSPAHKAPWYFPLGRIEDAPRFPWRGLMLDAARHFIPADALLQTLDLMAFYKLNVLHLHLSDDQGFRFPSAAWPKLASRESYRRAELRELVAQAATRGIRVVPELDMPGHVASWLAAYPEWGPQRQPVAASQRFGAHQAVLNPADAAVYQAVDALLGELAEIFPDPFVHIGGDEVQPDCWQESEEISAYMAQHGLSGPAALQAHFNQRVAALAARRGKRLIGWDEALHESAPNDMIVQAWRGATARDRALAAGHDCIVSSGYYLDLFYPADLHHAWDLGAPEDELLAQEDALLEDPRLAHVSEGIRWTHAWREIAGPKRTDAAPEARRSGNWPAGTTPAGTAPAGTAPASATPSNATHRTRGAVLGGEACLWSELVDERLLPVRLWSRMPAIAERFWSVEAVPGPAWPHATLNRRLQASLERLAELGLLDVREISQRLLRQFGVAESHLPVVELLEPIKWYGRLLGPEALRARIEGREAPLHRRYRADSPLNRPVDGLLPESFAASRFAALLNGAPAPLRRECQRLLALCRADGLLPELQDPVKQIAALLETVLAVLDGHLEPDAAIERAAAATQPQGEYIAALGPNVQHWLGRAKNRRDQRGP